MDYWAYSMTITEKHLTMNDNNDILRYTIKDTLCAKAVEEFKSTSSVREWLQENCLLYDSVTYQPPGLPRIMACNLGEQSFENIRKFGMLYDMVDSLFEEEERF